MVDGLPGAIPGNRWDLVPDSARLEEPSVSVCIPSRNGGRTLHRTLRMLALQTYPKDRFEVVVADDGSSPPIEVDSDSLPYDVRVVRQEAAGFGAGRARNLAAGAASGEVLVFLDADMIPEITVVRQYVSWTQRHPLCVPFGFSRFVDLSEVSDEQLEQALRSDHVDALLEADDVDSQDYRERYLHRTADLTVERLDAFRVFVSATFALSADLFARAGGFRELGVRGVEDIELGYRLANRGALLVPVRSARHWHQGLRTMSGDRIAEIRRTRQPFVERLLPVGGFRPERPLGPGPVTPVTRFVVHVAGDATESAVIRSIEALPPEDVALADPQDPGQEDAFADVYISPDLTWSPETSANLVQLLEDTAAGTLRIVVEDHDPVVVRRRRATRRAVAVGAVSAGELADRLFGVVAVVARDVGISDATMRPRRRRHPMRREIGRTWRRARRLADLLAGDDRVAG